MAAKAPRSAADPRISVIMSVYNGAPFVCDALESVLRQTFEDLEFIIIDDGSTDGTAQFLDRVADPRVRLLRHAQTKGLTTSLNEGLRLARGQYIARQDADDISAPERLERQVAFLELHPSVGLAGVTPVFVDAAGRERGIWPVFTDNERLQIHLPRSNGFCHGSVMFRRSCIEVVGTYDETFMLAQDMDLWLRIAELFDVANLPEPLYYHRVHDGRLSETRPQEQFGYVVLARERAAKRRRRFREETLSSLLRASGDGPWPRRVVTDRTWLADRYYLFAMGQRELGDRATAARLLIRALVTHAAHRPTWVFLLGFAGRRLRSMGRAAMRLLSLRRRLGAGS